MDAYTSVSLSSGNWKRVLDHLRERADVLDHLTTRAITDGQRTEAFVQREELRGIIEQIEDQLR
jgi:hypothetical protein